MGGAAIPIQFTSQLAAILHGGGQGKGRLGGQTRRAREEGLHLAFGWLLNVDSPTESIITQHITSECITPEHINTECIMS